MILIAIRNGANAIHIQAYRQKSILGMYLVYKKNTNQLNEDY